MLSAHSKTTMLGNPMDKIPLSEMLGQLRNELVQAQGAAEGSDLKLLIEDIEVELHVGTTKGGKGGGGVKFWVYNAEAEVNASEAKTQKIKLKLRAVHTKDDSPFNVGDEDLLGG
jgi:hypothetical protein